MKGTKEQTKIINNVGANASVRPTSMARQNKGITLIALVITIIVMLILVAVTISMAVNGGLFDYAGKAVGETQDAIDAEKELSNGRIQIGGIWYDSIGDYINNIPSSNQGGTNGESVINAVGLVDNQNTITLNETLPNDTYTLKYENRTGVLEDYEEICTLTVTGDDESRVYDDFIPQNIAPLEATIIGVYNSSNERVGDIALGHLATKLGNKLYSFGALMDSHIDEKEDVQEKFAKALTYLKDEENVEFTCIAGDLTNNGTEAELTIFKNLINTYSSGTPVYATTGNHERLSGLDMTEVIETYTGNPLYYSFTQGNDVFIMLGVCANNSESAFSTERLQWLYETLEANRDKRCYVFEHLYIEGGSGDPSGYIEYGNLMSDNEEAVLKSLLEHYTNAIFIHGHSHFEFAMQANNDMANYDNTLGIHSIHIPSISEPRNVKENGELEYLNNESEGYIIDVYENSIVLRGRDFAGNKFLPIAQYYLDTTKNEVQKNTYKDDTDTIDTTDKSVYNWLPLATDENGNIYNGIGYKDNTRWSSTTNTETSATGWDFTGFIPARKNYIIRLKNVTFYPTTGGKCAIKYYDGDKNAISTCSLQDESFASDWQPVYDTNGNISQITIPSQLSSSVRYIRIIAQDFNENSIITVNKPIE